MATPPAHIEPAVLRWARELAGFEIEAAAAKIGVGSGRLAAAEGGERPLTLRQAEQAARVFGRPFAVLFLPEPPKEEPAEAQFRRLPGAPTPPWPPAMHLLARTVTERQEAASEIYEELDERPAWLDVDFRFADDPRVLADDLRLVLGITVDAQRSWRDRRGYAPLGAWRDAIERMGVLVMQDGSFPVEEMRGFAALHPAVPAIVMNTKDDPRARTFTLIHEFGHLLRSRAGTSRGPSDESWCEHFAGELLMPAGPFAADLRALRPTRLNLLTVDELSLSYGVTPAAAAVRLARLGLAAQAEVEAVRVLIRQRRSRPGDRAGGGDYYRNTLARLGPAFTRLVFAGLDREAVTSAGAASLLGTRVDRFPQLMARLGDPVGVA